MACYPQTFSMTRQFPTETRTRLRFVTLSLLLRTRGSRTFTWAPANPISSSAGSLFPSNAVTWPDSPTEPQSAKLGTPPSSSRLLEPSRILVGAWFCVTNILGHCWWFWYFRYCLVSKIKWSLPKEKALWRILVSMMIMMIANMFDWLIEQKADAPSSELWAKSRCAKQWILSSKS